MGVLTRLGYPSTLYKEIERLTPDEARQRRVFSILEKERLRVGREQPVSINYHLNRLKDFESKFSSELEARARDARRRLRDDPNQKSRATKIAIFAFSQLQQRRSALLQRAASEKRRNQTRSAASAANRNYYSPYPLNPRSTSGTEAKTFISATSRRIFSNPLTSFPCIQRLVRREVLFARGHGGKGHKGRRRFNPLSHIGC